MCIRVRGENFNSLKESLVKEFDFTVCLHVLLVGIVVSLDINSKEELQKIADW